MPILSHEVIVADVVYPTVLLAFGRSIALSFNDGGMHSERASGINQDILQSESSGRG